MKINVNKKRSNQLEPQHKNVKINLCFTINNFRFVGTITNINFCADP